jgi:cytochrome bd-type quinol oxidase subunit 2
MREAFIHFLRYLGWALVGAVIVVALLLIWAESSSNETLTINLASASVALLAVLGALVLVLIRAAVGVATRAESVRADRITAVGLGRFVLGGAAGLFLAHRLYDAMVPSLFLVLCFEEPWWIMAFILCGACAGVATGWLAWRWHGQIALPVAWSFVFLLLVFGWLAISQELLHQHQRHRARRSAALELGLPHRVEQPLELRAGR